jgi:uncharacterized membrane protein
VTSNPLLRPLLVVGSVCALGAVVIVGIGSPLRPIVATWFFLTAPGLALTPLLRMRDVWGELAVVLSLSVALDIVVATGLMYVGAWSPALIATVLAAVSLAGAALQLRTGEAAT